MTTEECYGYLINHNLKVTEHKGSCISSFISKITSKNIPIFDADGNLTEFVVWMYISTYLKQVNTLVINLEIVDAKQNNYSIRDLKNIDLHDLANTIAKNIDIYLTEINEMKIELPYFENISEYTIRNDELWVPIYNYNTNNFKSLPVQKNIILTLSSNITAEDIYRDLRRNRGNYV